MVDLHGRGTGNVGRLPKGVVVTLFRAHLAAIAGGEPPSAEGVAAAGAALSLFGLDAWVLAPSKALASTTTAAIRKSATTLAAIAFVSRAGAGPREVVPVDGDVSPEHTRRRGLSLQRATGRALERYPCGQWALVLACTRKVLYECTVLPLSVLSTPCRTRPLHRPMEAAVLEPEPPRAETPPVRGRRKGPACRGLAPAQQATLCGGRRSGSGPWRLVRVRVGVRVKVRVKIRGRVRVRV